MLLPPCALPGVVVGDVLGSGNCAGLVTDCDDVSGASTAAGVKSGTPVAGGGASAMTAVAVSQVAVVLA